MTTVIPLLLAALCGLAISLLTGAEIGGMLAFTGFGLAGGLLAASPVRGAERVSWIALGLTVLMLVLAMLGVGVPGLAMVAPLTVALGDFVARTAARLLGASRGRAN